MWYDNKRYDMTRPAGRGACATMHHSHRPINDNVTIITAYKIRILFHTTLSFSILEGAWVSGHKAGERAETG